MEDILPARMSEVGSHVLVLFDEVKEQHFGSYIAKLFNKRETNDRFFMAHECTDGVVYVRKR